MIRFCLPFPDKALWPNGRAHWATKSRASKKHKEWGYYGVKAVADKRGLGREIVVSGRVDWSVTIHPKTRNAIDRDNALASLKAYQDGMAQALGVNDNQFNTPELTFGEPIKGGQVVIRLHL